MKKARLALHHRFGTLMLMALLGGILSLPSGPVTASGERPDLGDAPDTNNTFGLIMPLFPGGPKALFPTVFYAGTSPTGPMHQNRNGAFYYLGGSLTPEWQADSGPDADGANNIDPSGPSANNDGGDDGLILPSTFAHCDLTKLQYKVTKVPTGTTRMYINVWSDWNSNGRWGDSFSCSSTRTLNEWVVKNQPIDLVGSGTFLFTTPGFVSAGPTGKPQWLRITLSETPASHANGMGPGSGWEFGETEDYDR